LVPTSASGEPAPVAFAADELQQFAARIFTAHGLSEQHAARTAQCLVEADLRGLASHGVSRIPIYTERLRRGLVNARPALAVEAITPVVARVDGDNGLGFVTASRAMEEAIDRARAFGVSLVLTHRSTHFGMAASYLLQAVRAGFSAFVFTNASRAMPVWGGRTPFLGTSPFAFAAPGGDHQPPIVLDMATSVVARGKIRRAMQKGEPIPSGWALDAHGQPTTDAAEAYKGLILPLGGAKGSGLSLMMEVLAGVMSGAAFGGQVRNQYTDFDAPQGVGHCMIAMRPDLAMPAAAWRQRMDALVDRAKSSPRLNEKQKILMPGEPEARLEAFRREHGIPLAADEIAALHEEGDRVGLTFPFGNPI
jgi:L-2-hydroxycarboxylate dehydrogenase (NAD+)